jgi:hypothetical protein
MVQSPGMAITVRQRIVHLFIARHLTAHQVIIAHQVIVLQLIAVPAMDHLLIAHQVTIVRPLIVPLIIPPLFIKQLTTVTVKIKNAKELLPNGDGFFYLNSNKKVLAICW